MPFGAKAEGGLDDVQVMGMWNFTLQAETPLYWLRTGSLERYLLTFTMHTTFPSTCGLAFHSEADGSGIDGVSFWVERSVRAGRNEKRFCLAGEGLESNPVITRPFEDSGEDLAEDVEVMVQGCTGSILLHNRKVHLRFRCKQGRGSIAFYNTSQGEDPPDAHFSSVRVTALRRGPLEVGGILGRREQDLHREAASGTIAALDMDRSGAEAAPMVHFGEEEASHSFLPSPQASPHAGPSSPKAYSSLQGSSIGFRDTLTRPSHTSQPLVVKVNRRQPPKARLRSVASDGALRRSGGSLLGMPVGGSPSVTSTRTAQSKGTQHTLWVPLAQNAPASEMELVRSGSSMKQSDQACQDFIVLEQK
mmetsp:Transcript_72519/g.172915  ORF Transcript_72519/g.172915 Transcript_72519/m.172915 type:complete len:362 (-) Transcript_72519:109-1194(-)